VAAATAKARSAARSGKAVRVAAKTTATAARVKAAAARTKVAGKTTAKGAVKSAVKAAAKSAKPAAAKSAAKAASPNAGKAKAGKAEVLTTATKMAKATKPTKAIVAKASAIPSASPPAKSPRREETVKAAKVAGPAAGATRETTRKAPEPARIGPAATATESAKSQQAKIVSPVAAPTAPFAVARPAPAAATLSKTPATGEFTQVARNTPEIPSRPAAPAPAGPVAPAAPAAKPLAARAAPAPKAKTTAPKHGFKANEFIVYPAHGVGQIVGLEVQEVAGFSLELFVVSFVKDKMILKVPTSKAAGVGMRKLSEPETVEKALTTLSGRARIKRTMWSRRAQEYEAKINSGDLVTIAEVVRDLYRSDTQPEQSYSERQLYEAALDRMAREITAVRKLIDSESLKLIEAYLLKGPRRGQKTDAEAEDDSGDDDVVRAA
jgi:CarD family transcriptional regulator